VSVGFCAKRKLMLAENKKMKNNCFTLFAGLIIGMVAVLI
jgi:hypothetical protein